MSYGDLAAIKQRNKDDPDECFKDLLSCWLKQAKPRPTWEALVKALESQTVGHEQLAEAIKEKYCRIPVHILSNTIQSINGHQTCNDSCFHCPCGGCDLLSYLDNGCPKTTSKQYPYLELSNLDEDDKEDLIQKLSEDTANIIQSFANLLSTTSKSFNCRKVNVDELIKVALDLGAFKSDKNQLPLLGEDRHQLLQAKSIDRAFITLGEHMSFFNYEILSHIIEHLGSEGDQGNLAKYCSQFKTFCEHKVFEVPPGVFYPSGQKTKDRKLFVVLGTEDLFRNLNDVKAAQRKIASLLGLRMSTLQLKQIDLASVIFVFSIPASVWRFLQLDSLIFKTLSSIGFTLIIPDVRTHQNDLKVDDKDTVDQTSLLSLDDVDQISMLSLDTVDQRSVLSFEADQISLPHLRESDRLSRMSLATGDQRSVLSLEVVSNDSGFYSRSSSQMTLNSVGTPLPIATTNHPTNTVHTNEQTTVTIGRSGHLQGLGYITGHSAQLDQTHQTRPLMSPTSSHGMPFFTASQPPQVLHAKMVHNNRGATYPTTSSSSTVSPAGTPGHHTTIVPPFNMTHPRSLLKHIEIISRPEPPSTLQMHAGLLMSPTSPHGTPSPLTTPPEQKGLMRVDQLEKLAALFRRKNKKIGVFYNSKQKQKADIIVQRLSDLLSGGVCIVQGFEIHPLVSDWLQRALLGGVDYFIFVGLPPNIPRLQPSQNITETAFFNVQRYVQRVAEVVVVQTEQKEGRYTRTPHYLNKFLRLDNKNMEKVAEDALALFAGELTESI